MKNVLLVGALSLSVLSVASFSANANVVTLDFADVKAVTVSGTGQFGGCGFKLDRQQTQMSTETHNCWRSDWIALSCNGQFNQIEEANRMLQVVQRAAEQGKRVKVTVNQSQLHSNACVAKRVDVQY